VQNFLAHLLPIKHCAGGFAARVRERHFHAFREHLAVPVSLLAGCLLSDHE
jgi:hypothetical protein